MNVPVVKSSRIVEAEAALMAHLESIGVACLRQEHEPVWTMAEVEGAVSLPGAECKNLFVTDRKKRNLFLLVTSPQSRVDLRALGQQLGVGKLGLASESVLLETLGVTPGSVSMLSLIAQMPDSSDDSSAKVRFLIEESLWEQERLLMHPLRNDVTLSLTRKECESFLESLGVAVEVTSVPLRED